MTYKLLLCLWILKYVCLFSSLTYKFQVVTVKSFCNLACGFIDTDRIFSAYGFTDTHKLLLMILLL